ncbi:glutaredoxin domain-containing protein [Undibacterium terreum]|uniref:Glutaredoxin domain-containing protein n=1 Tax=Undibacterium terreum TaxID=1224302 RepID=A0A916UNC1_9BURK|nr:hypothetical protein GCM10011396_27680 [Undibacterium terreum]
MLSAINPFFTSPSTHTCPHCKKARDYLEQAGVPYNDQIIDESKSAEESFKTLGEKYVPVLVSSTELVVEFDQKAYANLIQLANSK